MVATGGEYSTFGWVLAGLRALPVATYFFKEIKLYDPCVGCGFCCLEAPCIAGRPDRDGRCTDLYWSEEDRRYWCSRAKSDRNFAIMIYVGEGCTANLNTWRREVKNRG